MEQIALILGIVAITHHNLAASALEEELLQSLLWYYYYQHPLSQPISFDFNWEAHLNYPNLEDNDSYFRARFRMSVTTVKQLILDLSPFHIVFQNGRVRISLEKMVLITLFRLGCDLRTRTTRSTKTRSTPVSSPRRAS